MDSTTRRPCPYCAEDIAATALRCPHCQSRLATFDSAAWRRDHGDRRVAGVASAIAHALAVPVGAVRLGFVMLSFIHLLGPVAYGVLWLLIPERADGSSILEHELDRSAATLRRWRGLASLHRGPGA